MNSFVSADRRATARTTTSLSHAAIRPKKKKLPGTGIRGDGENLYGGNLYGGSAQGVSGTRSGGVAVTGE